MWNICTLDIFNEELHHSCFITSALWCSEKKKRIYRNIKNHKSTITYYPCYKIHHWFQLLWISFHPLKTQSIKLHTTIRNALGMPDIPVSLKVWGSTELAREIQTNKTSSPYSGGWYLAASQRKHNTYWTTLFMPPWLSYTFFHHSSKRMRVQAIESRGKHTRKCGCWISTEQ